MINYLPYTGTLTCADRSLEVNSIVPVNIAHITCNVSYVFRSLDGSCNNLDKPWWGQPSTPFKRLLKSSYDDDLSMPRSHSVTGVLLPDPRQLALKIHNSNGKVSETKFSSFLALFGQFISHDLSLTDQVENTSNDRLCRCTRDANKLDKNCIPILIPREDTLNADQDCYEVLRSRPLGSKEFHQFYNKTTNKRQQLNSVTHWLDLSQVYGSSSIINSIRAHKHGLLKSKSSQSGETYLPYKSKNCSLTQDTPCFLSGDGRVNNNILLVSIHTLFLREHNRIARSLVAGGLAWNDERIFQTARKIVSLTYKLFYLK